MNDLDFSGAVTLEFVDTDGDVIARGEREQDTSGFTIPTGGERIGHEAMSFRAVDCHGNVLWAYPIHRPPALR